MGGYHSRAPHKTGAGRCNPVIQWRHRRRERLFYCRKSVPPFSAAQIRTESMVALAGQPSGWPVSLYRYCNPCQRHRQLRALQLGR
ncbi:ash family protein [Pantoea agglomerans]|nr:ash family protein [Pantoea agglomerans]